MKKIFEDYIQAISSKFSHIETSEMGYRTDFEILLKKVFESINVFRFDHDAKAEEGNKPDFVVRKNNIPILYIETKDIGVSLDKIEKSEQMSRYFGYANLILTDYVEFRFYRNGLPYGDPIKIAEYDKNSRIITPNLKNYQYLAQTLLDFTKSHKEPIRSGEHLSKIMGGKAQRIRDNIRQFLATESEINIELARVYKTIRELLVHDLTKESFADMYAQTLVYGLFVARFYDETPSDFTRQEARDLIPRSNPLLRHFFDHIVGPNFDKRLEYIVNELCEVFSHADVEKLMNKYLAVNLKNKTHRKQDTVIHFYENFLDEYDPELRKKMGAYYTPLPIVEFIVRSINHLLKQEFNLSKGLADTTKLSDGKHKVQILDPAVGTGTFISAIIGEIYKKFKGQEGRWPTYVHNDLLPRIHGFELMMAPYTIAHLKLAMAFKTTGFKYFNRRLSIYLTNSLEKTPNQESLFTAFGLAQSIAKESKEAAIIKNKTPIMVVIGNPPYSGISSNETEYANSLVKKYKVEPGGKQKLQERKHWLNDDYVKFIALAEGMIEKNNEGLLGFITNHAYLDNPTFRGMRWHLMNTFDKIFILDLHGNAIKKEKSPDSSEDENVFDIKQGVAIILAIKNKLSKRNLAKIYHADLWGRRKDKFKKLNNSSIKNIQWTQLNSRLPHLFFIPQATEKLEKEYNQGFKVNELFKLHNTGLCSQRDAIVMQNSHKDMSRVIKDFEILDIHTLKQKYKIKKDGRDWTIKTAKQEVVSSGANTSLICKVAYRPFDLKYTYYTGKSRGFIAYPRGNVFSHLTKNNLCLTLNRNVKFIKFNHVFVTQYIPDLHLLETGNASLYGFPLYLYHGDGVQTPNFNQGIIDQIEKNIGNATPESILDYIYAVLHSPSYRKKYKDFLKIDFPRVPYPKNKNSFKKLVKIGSELRALHLLESPKVNKFITTYPESGSGTVEKPIYKTSNVYINDKQYFGKVTEVAWNFYIGGYQPAQKWLKDRKGKTLTNSDIEHYQKIIVALTETNRIMKKIDQLLNT
ncbi:MAG: type ISP restriction/modification enzyme [Candidatus Shapirobacteria bacterium]